MSLPIGDCDLVGNLVTASDLGLTSGTVLATASPKDLTAFRCPVPETVLVLCRLSSGTVDLQVDVASSAAFGSADGSTSNFNDTVGRYVVVDTSSANSYVNVRLVTSANCIVDRLAALSLSKLTAGEEFKSVRAGRNAVSGGLGTSGSDSSGAFVLTL